MEVWVLPALMGLGLAAATGLRTFLPLLVLAAVARMGLFGVTINPHVAWLGSTHALVALGVATVVELAADKIPLVDHALSGVGVVTRPLAGVLAAGAVFSHVDPAMAAVAGLIVGAPTALAFHAAQAGTRVVSTTTTAGLGNPIVSLVEDAVSAILSLLAILAPVLAALAVAALLFVGFRSWAFLRKRAS
ncbi:DUF4126 domain-containing protein [Phenylobacterium sp.]|jgi:hypothetical protein|uniref:DUF4126 domain-containing protein n=1 Tax=Phenylobacterium sp. TaxID=1871053 RepID=UPI002F4077AC